MVLNGTCFFLNGISGSTVSQEIGCKKTNSKIFTMIRPNENQEGHMIEEDCGWISPDGRFYPCSYRKHSECASDIISKLGMPENADPQKYLECRGWVRITHDPLRPNTKQHRAILTRKLFITKDQSDKLVSLGYESNDDYRDLLEASEMRW